MKNRASQEGSDGSGFSCIIFCVKSLEKLNLSEVADTCVGHLKG